MTEAFEAEPTRKPRMRDTIREVPPSRRLQFAIVLPFALLVLWVLAKAQERSERV